MWLAATRSGTDSVPMGYRRFGAEIDHPGADIGHMAQEFVDGAGKIRQSVTMATTRVLVCDGDELARRAFGRTATDHGLELVGEAQTAVEALQMLTYLPAEVVVMTNELQGLTGIEVTPELAATGARVIIVSSDGAALDSARRAGAFAAVPRGDLAAFERALDAVTLERSADDRRSGTDRRSGQDRRVAQEWTKVIRERRAGAERRVGDRREQADSQRRGAISA
jgi:chemotaxis response regulator CheB